MSNEISPTDISIHKVHLLTMNGGEARAYAVHAVTNDRNGDYLTVTFRSKAAYA